MIKKKNIAKVITIVVIVLFIGTSFLPGITANIHNKYLKEDFTITITKPENAIYRDNQKLIPFLIPLILRDSIDIEIKISPMDTLLDRIVILFNNVEIETITGPGPFSNPIFKLDGKAFSKDKIEVVGYDGSSQSSDSIIIWRIFP